MAPKQVVYLEAETRNVMSVEIPGFHRTTRTLDPNDIYSYGYAFTSGDLDGAVKMLSDLLPGFAPAGRRREVLPAHGGGERTDPPACQRPGAYGDSQDTAEHPLCHDEAGREREKRPHYERNFLKFFNKILKIHLKFFDKVSDSKNV